MSKKPEKNKKPLDNEAEETKIPEKQDAASVEAEEFHDDVKTPLFTPQTVFEATESEDENDENPKVEISEKAAEIEREEEADTEKLAEEILVDTVEATKNPFKRFAEYTKLSLKLKIENRKERFQNYKALPSNDKKRWWIDFLLNNAIYIVFLAFILYVWIYCYVEKDLNFLSSESLVNLINRTAFSCFLALGVGGVIVLTGTDLSAGRAMGLIACICASLLQAPGLANKMWPNMSPPPVFWVLVLALIVGALIGLFNGFFTAKFKMHPFISTLGTSMILAGLVLMYVNMGNNGGVSITGLDTKYFNAINGTFKFLGSDFPYYVIYAGLAILLTWFIWNKTRLGKNMYAVGANPEAANVSGVSVFWTTVLLFVYAGIMYGFSGFVDAARVGSNNPSTGVGFELNAIAACVIGGVSFTGGVGKVRGIMLGVILLQLVSVGLQWLGVQPYFQSIITGFIILFAVAVDMRKYIAKK